MLRKAFVWLLRLFLPQFVLGLLADFFKMPLADDSPDMHAFVDMAAAALQSKNHFIHSQQERLELAEAAVSQQREAVLRLEREVAELRLEALDRAKDAEVSRALVEASELRIAELLLRDEERQAELSLLKEEKSQVSVLRERSMGG